MSSFQDQSSGIFCKDLIVGNCLKEAGKLDHIKHLRKTNKKKTSRTLDSGCYASLCAIL